MATKKDENQEDDKKVADAPKAVAAKKKAAPKKKVAAKKEEKEDASEAVEEVEMKKGSFIATVGRRKTAIARVRLVKNGTGKIVINGRPMEKYFTTFETRKYVNDPLITTGQLESVDVSVKVIGGGMHGQSQAVRHGISRALIELNPTFRKTLKKLGFLSRDPREKERKKFGLKKARRAPQWSKR